MIKNDDNSVGIILTGSREFSDVDKIREELERIIEREKAKKGEELGDITIYTDGNSPSLETIASELVAKEYEKANLKHSKIVALWDKYGKKAGYWRDKKLCELSNYCLIFRDGPKEELKNAPYRFLISMARKERLILRDFPTQSLPIKSTILISSCTSQKK